MQSTHTTDQIIELSVLIAALDYKQDHLTDEEHEVLTPILKAAQPLLDKIEEAIYKMEEFDDSDYPDVEDEEEDWS